jgi:hypothetical protein
MLDMVMVLMLTWWMVAGTTTKKSYGLGFVTASVNAYD